MNIVPGTNLHETVVEFAHSSIVNAYDLQKIQSHLSAAAAGLESSTHRVLVLVAHPDDEVLGPGGTLAMLSEAPNVALFILVFAASNPQRALESAQFADALNIPRHRSLQLNLPDGRLAELSGDVACIIRSANEILRPDVVFTHRLDNHPDHRTLHLVTCESFGRNGTTIFSFSIPQPLQTPFSPTTFIRIPATAAQKKVPLSRIFATESSKDYFDEMRLTGILRDAGLTAGSAFGEAFEANNVNIAIDRDCCGIRLAHHPDGTGRNEPRTRIEATIIRRLVLELCPNGCGALVQARNSGRFLLAG